MKSQTVRKAIFPIAWLGTRFLPATKASAKEQVVGVPFAVLQADDLMVGGTPIMAQMVEQFVHWGSSILAVQDVPAFFTGET